MGHPSRVANILITPLAHHKTGVHSIKMMEPLKNHTIQSESTILNVGNWIIVTKSKQELSQVYHKNWMYIIIKSTQASAKL